MKVLVTGATGFVGKHLALALAAAGHAVRALVRPTKRARSLADAGLEIFEGQLTSAGVDAAAEGCSRIYHLAAAFPSSLTIASSTFARLAVCSRTSRASR